MVQEIKTANAPSAIGPYSQGVVFQGLVFVSGQIPLDLAAGQIVEQTIEGQTELVLDHIEAILASEGLRLEHVVKAEIYLKDLNDAPVVNAIYGARFFSPIKPARQLMQVARLPRDSLIEISCIAVYRS